jgi:hypothetical protein
LDEELDELFEEYSGVCGTSADILGTLIRGEFSMESVEVVDSVVDSCTDKERT